MTGLQIPLVIAIAVAVLQAIVIMRLDARVHELRSAITRMNRQLDRARKRGWLDDPPESTPSPLPFKPRR